MDESFVTINRGYPPPIYSNLWLIPIYSKSTYSYARQCCQMPDSVAKWRQSPMVTLSQNTPLLYYFFNIFLCRIILNFLNLLKILTRMFYILIILPNFIIIFLIQNLISKNLQRSKKFNYKFYAICNV